MEFNVAQLLREGVGATRRVQISGELRDIDELNPGPVSVSGNATLVRIPSGILAMGTAEARVAVACRRCLEVFESDVTIGFEEEFVPSIDVVTGLALDTSEAESADLVIDPHHILDLAEVLRQYIVMGISDLDICRPDCRGLCPICGQNLNVGTCNCQTVRIDPRLAVLAKLLETKEEPGPSEGQPQGEE
jgi:uncharacterized protein